MRTNGFGIGDILKLVVIQCLVHLAEHGDEAATSPSTESYTKPFSGASFVQKKSRMQKQTQEIVDEDDEKYLTNDTAVGNHEAEMADANAKHVQLAVDKGSMAKSSDHGMFAETGEAAKAGAAAKLSNEQLEFLGEAVVMALNVAQKGDDGFTVSMVGNLSNPNASGASLIEITNSSEHAGSSKWPLSLISVAQDRCWNMAKGISANVLSVLVAQHWVPASMGGDEEGSVLLILFGIIVAIILFAALSCVHRLASKPDDSEDSSTSWFRQLDDSSPFVSPNRHLWMFQWLGFAWTSRFSAKPMPPYSVRGEHFDSGA